MGENAEATSRPARGTVDLGPALAAATVQALVLTVASLVV